MMRLLAQTQLMLLRLINRFAPAKSRVSLFYPRISLACGGRVPLVSYKEVFVGQIYEPPVDVPDVRRVVDLGGHVGLAALYFAHRFPDATVISVEANPQAFELLRQNVAHLNERVEPHACAAAAEAGSTRMFVEDYPGIPTDSTVLPPSAGKAGEYLEVPAEAISSLVGSGADLIKFDIEGAEYDCLAALTPSPERVRAMVIEFHRLSAYQSRMNQLLGELSAAGYEIYGDGGVKLSNPVATEEDSVLIWAIAPASPK